MKRSYFMPWLGPPFGGGTVLYGLSGDSMNENGCYSGVRRDHRLGICNPMVSSYSIVPIKENVPASIRWRCWLGHAEIRVNPKHAVAWRSEQGRTRKAMVLLGEGSRRDHARKRRALSERANTHQARACDQQQYFLHGNLWAKGGQGGTDFRDSTIFSSADWACLSLSDHITIKTPLRFHSHNAHR